MPPDGRGAGRGRLSRERVVAAALAIADTRGTRALTMRSLAAELGVRPMSLYHHVADKEAILDAITDAVFAEIEVPPPGTPWRQAMRTRAVSAREALARHPWAVTLMDSRATPGPATLRHHDAVIGVLRADGIPLDMVGHAFALLDAYVFGFAVQEAALPFDRPEEASELAAEMAEALPAGEFPHLVAFASEHVARPGYDFGAEFDFGLDLILDGLDARVRGAGGSTVSS